MITTSVLIGVFIQAVKQLPQRQFPSSRRETFSKSQQQSRGSLDADSSAQQSPEKIALLRQETEPCLTIRPDNDIGFPSMTLRHLESLIANRNGRVAFFRAGEGEVISSIQPLGSVWLEG